MSIDNQYDYDDRPRRRPQPAGDPGLLRSLLLIGLGAMIAGAAVWAVGHFRALNAPPLTNPDAKPREASPKEPLDFDEQEAVAVFKKVKPSVVNVDIVQRQRVGWDDRPAEQQTGAGSGFIWDDDGHMVTNYHVVAALGSRPNMIVRVVLADRTAYDAVVVGVAEEYDLAVLQFAPHNVPPKDKIKKIDLGSSADLEVGQKAFAIGNPYGLSLTMTKGIISALGRTLESPARTPIPGGIQTDAPINPGNSGGPLLDKSGRLIGVNSSITTPTEHGGNVGIGFAIPADLVNQVVTQIIQTGRVLRPDLGVRLYDQQKLRRARYDRGVMVESTVPKGPADAAGIRGIRPDPRTGRLEPGDLIVAINGEPVDSPDDYEKAVRGLKPGEQAKLKVVRIEWAGDGGRRTAKEVEREIPLTVGGA